MFGESGLFRFCQRFLRLQVLRHFRALFRVSNSGSIDDTLQVAVRIAFLHQSGVNIAQHRIGFRHLFHQIGIRRMRFVHRRFEETHVELLRVRVHRFAQDIACRIPVIVLRRIGRFLFLQPFRVIFAETPHLFSRRVCRFTHSCDRSYCCFFPLDKLRFVIIGKQVNFCAFDFAVFNLRVILRNVTVDTVDNFLVAVVIHSFRRLQHLVVFVHQLGEFRRRGELGQRISAHRKHFRNRTEQFFRNRRRVLLIQFLQESKQLVAVFAQRGLEIVRENVGHIGSGKIFLNRFFIILNQCGGVVQHLFRQQVRVSADRIPHRFYNRAHKRIDVLRNFRRRVYKTAVPPERVQALFNTVPRIGNSGRRFRRACADQRIEIHYLRADVIAEFIDILARFKIFICYRIIILSVCGHPAPPLPAPGSRAAALDIHILQIIYEPAFRRFCRIFQTLRVFVPILQHVLLEANLVHLRVCVLDRLNLLREFSKRIQLRDRILQVHLFPQLLVHRPDGFASAVILAFQPFQLRLQCVRGSGQLRKYCVHPLRVARRLVLFAGKFCVFVDQRRDRSRVILQRAQLFTVIRQLHRGRLFDRACDSRDNRNQPRQCGDNQPNRVRRRCDAGDKPHSFDCLNQRNDLGDYHHNRSKPGRHCRNGNVKPVQGFRTTRDQIYKSGQPVVSALHPVCAQQSVKAFQRCFQPSLRRFNRFHIHAVFLRRRTGRGHCALIKFKRTAAALRALSHIAHQREESVLLPCTGDGGRNIRLLFCIQCVPLASDFRHNVGHAAPVVFFVQQFDTKRA